MSENNDDFSITLEIKYQEATIPLQFPLTALVSDLQKQVEDLFGILLLILSVGIPISQQKLGKLSCPTHESLLNLDLSKPIE